MLHKIKAMNPSTTNQPPLASLLALSERRPVLDPAVLTETAERAAHALLRQGESANTRMSYGSAMRYWAAWYAARFGDSLSTPVPVPVVIQFIVDHASRTSEDGGTLVSELPADVDAALVAARYKARLGVPALNTLSHRLAVLSKAHQQARVANPCADAVVRELLARTRRAYAQRGVRTHKQRALTKDPLQLVLATCDDTLRGKRDRALLLFAWASGGRRRSEVASADMENLVRVDATSYLYTLGHSKTNQTGELRPEDVKPLVGSAAVAMTDWLEASRITEGKIFRSIRKGGHLAEPLAPAAVRDIVKARCLLAGVEGDFSAHSLRAGFVTEAGRQNMSLPETMAMTGHQSVTVVMGYFRAESALGSKVGRMMDGDEAH